MHMESGVEHEWGGTAESERAPFVSDIDVAISTQTP